MQLRGPAETQQACLFQLLHLGGPHASDVLKGAWVPNANSSETGTLRRAANTDSSAATVEGILLTRPAFGGKTSNGSDLLLVRPSRRKMRWTSAQRS